MSDTIHNYLSCVLPFKPGSELLYRGGNLEDTIRIYALDEVLHFQIDSSLQFSLCTTTSFLFAHWVAHSTILCEEEVLLIHDLGYEVQEVVVLILFDLVLLQLCYGRRMWPPQNIENSYEFRKYTCRYPLDLIFYWILIYNHPEHG